MVVIAAESTVDRNAGGTGGFNLFQVFKGADFSIFMDFNIQIEFRIGKMFPEHRGKSLFRQIASRITYENTDVVVTRKISSRIFDFDDTFFFELFHRVLHRDITSAEYFRQSPQRRQPASRMQIACFDFRFNIVSQSFNHAHRSPVI